MSRERLGRLLVLAAVFLLPWQTRLIWGQGTIDGQATEYGTLSLYAVELLVLAAAFVWWPLRPAVSSRVTKGLLAVFAAALLSAAFGASVVVSFNALLHLGFAALFFLLLCDPRVAARQAGAAFIAGLFLPAALGLFQVLVGASPSSTLLGLADRMAERPGDAVVVNREGLRLLRAYGSFPHPNVFGGFLAVGSVLWIWLRHAGTAERNLKRNLRRSLEPVVLVALLAALAVTFSRSAWLAFALGAAAFYAVSLLRGRLRAREAFPEAALALLVAVAVGFLFHDQIAGRFTPSLPLEARSIEERGSQFPQALAVFRVDPFTGAGPGNYVFGLAAVRPGFPAWSYQPVHHVPLLVVSELGLLGLLAAAYALTRIPWRRLARAALPAAFATLLLPPLLLDHYLWTLWSGLALFAFCAALALKTVDERS